MSAGRMATPFRASRALPPPMPTGGSWCAFVAGLPHTAHRAPSSRRFDRTERPA